MLKFNILNIQLLPIHKVEVRPDFKFKPIKKDLEF
jgi:hypothetical protein